MGLSRVLHYFEEISSISRLSYHEEEIAQYLLKQGKALGILANIDDENNVILKKESPIPDTPCLVLQAHTDMVWASDFEDDLPIKIPQNIRITDGIMHAGKTSLGADNGMGMALILALFEENLDSNIALEALFTSNEEETMGGALALKENQVSGKYLINLDSEQEGVFTIGSAGGISVSGNFLIEKTPVRFDKQMEINLSGGLGGHSGLDIGRKRQNAILLLIRFLQTIPSERYQLCSIHGGERSNAIPQRASAVIATDELDYLLSELDSFWNKRKSQWQTDEPQIAIHITEAAEAQPFDLAFSDSTKKNLLLLLESLPHGVAEQTEDFICSSANLALLKEVNECLEVEISLRSSYDYWCKDNADKIARLINLFGGESQIKDSYAAWEFNPNSKLKDFLLSTYFTLFKEPAKFENVHAGVECGIIMDNCPCIKEAISIGPTIKNAHTTSETVDIVSVEKVFKLLNSVLNNIGGLDNE